MSGLNGHPNAPDPKLTPEVHQILVEAIAKGATRERAADLAGVGTRSVYRWLARGKKDTAGPYWQLWHDIKRARGRFVEYCLTAINEAAITHWQAAAWLLERRESRHYGRKVDVGERLEKVLAELEKARDAQLG